MIIGILYCGYNQLNNIKNTLCFWNNLKLDNVSFIVCTVSVPFLEYKDIKVDEDGTLSFIQSLEKDNIKNCIFEPRFVKERIARNHAMEFLSKYDIDYLWQVDSDEYYTKENVCNIISYILETQKPSYSVNFKNYILDGKHYLDDFCVSKINKAKEDRLLSFFDDNQIIHLNYGLTKPTPIPKEVALVKHLTWLHENGKQKVEYQLKHFGDCSYRWNSDKNELEIDLDYYKRHGYKVPNILKDGD